MIEFKIIHFDKKPNEYYFNGKKVSYNIYLKRMSEVLKSSVKYSIVEKKGKE